MKNRWMCLMCLALALLLPAAALAEALPVEEDEAVFRDQAEALVNEFDLTLNEVSSSGDETPSDATSQELSGEALDATALPEATPDPTPEPTPEPAKPLSVQVIKVTKSCSKSAYLGVPFALDVKGGIKSVSSSDKKIATASKDGALALKKNGKVKLTIKTGKGKKYTVSLTVYPTPVPGGVGVTAHKGKFTLSWEAARYATGYLVKYSHDCDSWKKYAVLDAGELSLNVTELVTGATWFRVTALLGDVNGGTGSASALAPITDVKVICKEEYYKGPGDQLNVTWSPCGGASAYEVYRAVLPSDDYELLGTTTKTWYPDRREAKKLCAYRVKPVCDGVELPMSEPVTLWSGMSGNVLPPSKLTSKTGIILLVNKKAQVVTAYVQDRNGKYTIPLRHMICSTGRTYERTRNGTWKIEGRKGQWYTYPGPSGDTIRWPTKYRSGYYFHSPLYNRNHSIRGYTVDRLGDRASAGCVRLKVTDAEWVYKNCGNGTTVYICDGKSNKELKNALKPKTVKVNGF